MAIKMGIRDVSICGDLQFIINQLQEYEVQKEVLVLYHKHALRLLDRLDIVKLEHVSRNAKKIADALASLATTLALGAKKDMTFLVYSRWDIPSTDKDSKQDVNLICVLETDSEDWFQRTIKY